jgi:hypothetical protein
MPESPEKTAWLKKYKKKCAFFPTRALSCLQPGRGKIVLPRGNPDVVKLWEFFRDAVKLDEDQVIWFTYDPNHSMEFDFINDAEAVQRVAEHIEGTPLHHSKRRFFIFCNRPEIMPWAEQMGLEVVCDSNEWRDRYGFKDILHPRPHESQSFLESLLPPGVTVTVPRGYYCSNTEELMAAVALMKAAPGPPMTDVCIKPVGASDGDGIEFVKLHDNDEKFASYQFLMGEVSLEEKLVLDKNPDGSLMTVVTHFCAEHLLGPSCDQLVGNAASETAFIGNVYPSEVPRPARKKCEAAALAIMHAANPKGPGGYDFLFQGGEPYLVDVNCGRFNGGMYPKAFHKQFASRKTAYVSFKYYNPMCSLDEVNAIIKEKGWQFHPILPEQRTFGMFGRPDEPGERGIFPLVHLPGMFGSYVAIAESREECIRMKDEFMSLAL